MSTLWVFGDSFTKGLGLVDDGHQYAPYKGKEDLIWSKLLADHLNSEHVNIAYNGISNDMIWDNVLEEFDRITEGDTVVIGLTKYARFGVYAPGHKQVGLFNKAPVRDTQQPANKTFCKLGLQHIRDNIIDVLENTTTNFTFLIDRFKDKGVQAYLWDETLWKEFKTITQEIKETDDHWGVEGHRQMFEYLKKEMKL